MYARDPHPSLVPPADNHPSVDPSQQGVLGALSAHWEVAAYALLLAVALLMRLWDLGDRAIGYDESLHAYYSFRLAEGLGFQHSPLMHGPFQFHGVAAMFFFFGDSDFTSRLLPALFGTALVGLPYLLRSRLGKAGALATAFMLAFSPMMLFYSRYARNDILMAVWTLALVIVMWRYFEGGNRRYLYWGAIVLALAFATKETTFIVVAILGSYLLIIASADWIPWLLRRPKVVLDATGSPENIYTFTPGYGYAYGVRRRPPRLAEFSRPGVFLVVFASLVAPQAVALISFFQNSLKSAGIVLASSGPPVGAPAGDVLFTMQDIDITKGTAFAVMAVVLALWFSALVGTTWSKAVWLRAAALFYGVWLLLYTTFLTNLVGVGSGVWQSLGYWLVQQEERRGNQPWYYYFLLAPIYETLPLIFATVAVVYYSFRGNSFSRFLAYWTVLTFVLYTWAGEKMPWLLVNITLPMIILSGKLLGEMISAVQWRRVSRSGGLYLVLMTPLLPYLMVRLLLFNVEKGHFLNFLEFWSLLAVALTLVGLGIHLMLRSGVANGLRVVALSFAMLLLVLSARTAWQAAFNNGDVPVEMIVYAQDSADVPRIMQQVQAVAQVTGEGEKLRLTVDKDIYWGLVWYIRGFDTVDYADLSSLSQAPEGRVLLISDGNESKVEPYLDKYGPGQPFTYLWWPGEGYKPCASAPVEPCLEPSDVPGNLLSRDKWREWLDYYILRKTDVDFLFHKAIAYFPKES